MADHHTFQKEAASQDSVVEHIDETSPVQGLERLKPTRRMILLGVYVGMSGWMYNFDLGE